MQSNLEQHLNFSCGRGHRASGYPLRRSSHSEYHFVSARNSPRSGAVRRAGPRPAIRLVRYSVYRGLWLDPHNKVLWKKVKPIASCWQALP